ncbi:MAG: sodium ion-translocating decarboxylase subunit beta [Sulfurospirillum sp.]|jgi:sodium ion-translocating decarboxylase beta subunit|nr:sodium ion-translocating decarboxylase subunit beta [Sulfurospirillum sp.]MBP9492208.1 sodium ion-translocating decarboxylase subunit beta [Sulfurospirillum sp.]MBP9612731.1 sodium ion-translocating decarboxylase subunit beta [Sulfurospirillum sp.]
MKKIIIQLLILLSMSGSLVASDVSKESLNQDYKSKSVMELFESLYESTGLNAMINPQEGLVSHGVEVSTFNQGWGRIVMMAVCFTLFYLAIAKGFEPLLLIPIAFGGFLANIPVADIAGPEGFLGILFNMGISSGLFPLMIFMGVGAMTDFGPLLANPKTALLGGAAQLGIFGTVVGAAFLTEYVDFINFSLKDACAIGIIGGADGPTSIFVASRLAPDLLGAIAVAAYSYMALVPIIQPPIMRALTTKEERVIRMEQLREVSKLEKILFPITVMVLCILMLPDATPLIGALAFGNLARESGVVKRLSETMENSLINIVTIFLGLSVGSKLAAEKFLVPETMGIIVLGLIAFSVGTAGGVIMAKIMNKFSKHKVNPLIGSAGVSAVPMAARVSNKEGMKADPTNMLLMHAMGPNVAGVIGSAVAAGVLLSIFK